MVRLATWPSEVHVKLAADLCRPLVVNWTCACEVHVRVTSTACVDQGVKSSTRVSTKYLWLVELANVFSADQVLLGQARRHPIFLD